MTIHGTGLFKTVPIDDHIKQVSILKISRPGTNCYRRKGGIHLLNV